MTTHQPLRFAATTLLVTLALAGCDRDEPRRPAAAPPAPTPTAPAPTAAVSPAVLARGDYLVNTVMNCGGCHTPMGPDGRPDPSRHLAGGLEIPEPFGTWRSPNITPDRRTGIGDWTDAQIADAIRRGVRPSGAALFAIMPYMYYHAVSDDDVAAIVAYLRTVKPVEQAVAGNTDLKLPRVVLPPPAGTPPASDPVARGAYLSSMMTCGHCHTPWDATGAPDPTRLMAGGNPFETPPQLGTGVLFAPNLTPDPETGVGRYTDEELLAAITRMTRRDGTPIHGPMALLGATWSRLEPDDARALVAYLRSLPPVKHAVPASTWKPAAAPQAAQR